MGVDIHMSIVKDGKIIAEDIFNGRNSRWFGNIMGDGYDPEYDHLPIKHGVSPQAPKELADEYKADYMYGHRYISVKNFTEWFNKYNPHLDAGWVSTYDQWALEHKNIKPENVWKEKPTENPEDWHFIAFEKDYDCSLWLMKFLGKINAQVDADITYCFDH